MVVIQVNTVYSLDAIVTDDLGNGISGLDISFKIYKSSENSLQLSGTLNSLGDGIYNENIIMTLVGQYRVVYNLPDYYLDSIETFFVEDKVTKEQVDTIQATLNIVKEVIYTNNIIMPYNPNSITGINKYSFNNVVILLNSNVVGYGTPVLTANYSSISLQCIAANVSDSAKICVSNDGNNWSEVHTFTGSGTFFTYCFKWIIAYLVQGTVSITATMHK